MPIPSTVFPLPAFDTTTDTVFHPPAASHDSSSDLSATSLSPIVPRSSNRTRHTPLYLQHYYCQSVQSTSAPSLAVSGSGNSHSIFRYLGYSNLSPAHLAFTSAITVHTEPKTFQQAVQHSEWREAMRK